MAKFYDQLDDKLSDLIRQQKLFFVATADRCSRVTLSPRGTDSLGIPGPNLVAWLNLTGSGNETVARALSFEWPGNDW